jgi:uncharacterized protein (UPF0276 family)
MKPLGAGFVVHPDREYLQLCAPILEREAEFYEVAPDAFWVRENDNSFRAGPFADVLERIRDASGRPLVAHGLGLSPGTSEPDHSLRLKAWLKRIERDQARFDFAWYTEHLGWCAVGQVANLSDGQSGGQVGNLSHSELLLPLPLPPTDEAVATVAHRLAMLKRIVPFVGFENQTSFIPLDDLRTEAGFWNRICAKGDLWLLLDLHNAWTHCRNFGVSTDEYLADLDFARVIEVHLSGGSESDPDWLPSKRTYRLDSHDGPVPEAVWELFEEVRPKCTNLRGVVVERLDGTIEPGDVSGLAAEVQRAKRIFWEK